MKRKPEELYKLLSAPLPPEALRSNPGFGIAINDGYVKERLNEVLGPDGWRWKPAPKVVSCEIWRDIEGRQRCDDKGSIYWETTAEATIFIPAFKKSYFGQGGCVSTDRGNSRKGAITDAFGKALSDLIGIEVYKGMLDQEFKLGEKGNKSIYLVGIESGWLMRENGLSREEAIKKGREEYESKK